MTWGDKFTQKEVNEALDACEVDDNGNNLLRVLGTQVNFLGIF